MEARKNKNKQTHPALRFSPQRIGSHCCFLSRFYSPIVGHLLCSPACSAVNSAPHNSALRHSLGTGSSTEQLCIQQGAPTPLQWEHSSETEGSAPPACRAAAPGQPRSREAEEESDGSTAAAALLPQKEADRGQSLRPLFSAPADVYYSCRLTLQSPAGHTASSSTAQDSQYTQHRGTKAGAHFYLGRIRGATPPHSELLHGRELGRSRGREAHTKRDCRHDKSRTPLAHRTGKK